MTKAPSRSLHEKRIVVGIAVLILVVTSLPYAYGYISTPPDKHFMGFLYLVPDHAQYLAWFRGFQESVLIDNRLTPEPNEQAFFNLLWFILGRLSLYTGLGYEPIYQLLRWCSGGLFLCAAYICCSLAFAERWKRLASFLLIALGAGLGWILIIIKYVFRLTDVPWPLDLYVAEPNSFLCIMGVPHFSLAAALIIFALVLLFQGYIQQKMWFIIGAALVTLILGLQHTYDLILIYGIWGFFTLLLMIRERRLSLFLIMSLVVLGSVSWWPALYSVWLTRSNPMWEEILAQFALSGTFTPNPMHLLILLGLPFIVTVLTFRGLGNSRHKGEFWLLLRVWFFVNFFLAYIPTDFQIHMLNGWQVPIAILAIDGVFHNLVPYLTGYIQERWHNILSEKQVAQSVGIVFVLLCVPTNLYLLTWRFAELERHNYPYYLYQDEIKALRWLDDHAESQDVVLASVQVGRFIPVFAGSHTFLGHWAQTVSLYDKRERVERFFDAEIDDTERLETLQTFQVDYVIYGPAERVLGRYDLSKSSLFSVVFSSPQVTVYHVNKPKDTP